MSESETASITASGSGKSEAEVAFDLLNKLKGQGVWGERNLTAILDMYAECLDAAKGLRPYAGQTRVNAPIHAPGSNVQPAARAAAPNSVQPQVQSQAQPLAQTPAQPLAQAPLQPQAQPVQAQPMQAKPVQAQQQMLQQAFKQASS